MASEITQADIDAARAANLLRDYKEMPALFAAHRTAAVAELVEALGKVPIPGKTEPSEAFYARMDEWLAGPYRTAMTRHQAGLGKGVDRG